MARPARPKQLEAARPHHPAPYDPADAYALKALQRGEANEGQQKRALAWIINQCAGTYDLSFRPENPHETSFAEGKRFVGLQIVKLLNMPGALLNPTRTHERS